MSRQSIAKSWSTDWSERMALVEAKLVLWLAGFIAFVAGYTAAGSAIFDFSLVSICCFGAMGAVAAGIFVRPYVEDLLAERQGLQAKLRS